MIGDWAGNRPIELTRRGVNGSVALDVPSLLTVRGSKSGVAAAVQTEWCDLCATWQIANTENETRLDSSGAALQYAAGPIDPFDLTISTERHYNLDRRHSTIG